MTWASLTTSANGLSLGGSGLSGPAGFLASGDVVGCAAGLGCCCGCCAKRVRAETSNIGSRKTFRIFIWRYSYWGTPLFMRRGVENTRLLQIGQRGLLIYVRALACSGSESTIGLR